jgi:hydroxymethylglutaryl-CoA synthase
MAGIVAYNAYIPFFRLERARIGGALGTPSGKGTRAVASYDEDATSMAVEAARPIAGRASFDQLIFATSDPPYLDKTNATAIHAALGLNEEVAAYDFGGSVRSAAGANRAGLNAPDGALVVASDVRTGRPGSGDELSGGDAAVAILYGSENVIAEKIGGASASAEFLDRWRVPGEPFSRVWEERFGEVAYVPLAQAALTDALKGAGLTEVDHLVVTGVHPRAARRLGATVDDLTAVIGNTGAAHRGLVLADVLDRAEPGQTIAVLTLADGADCAIFRTTEAIASYARATTVREQIEAGSTDLDYPTFLTWRGQLHREPPRRPDPTAPSAPPSFRREHWKFGFEASRCENCSTRHLPPARVCVKCRAVDQMTGERLADVPATIATFTIDRLAFSLSPPTVVAVVDFDGGGRFQCELTDVDPATVKIGNRVEMTFRKIYTADGVHNYFWKARPQGRANVTVRPTEGTD